MLRPDAKPVAYDLPDRDRRAGLGDRDRPSFHRPRFICGRRHCSSATSLHAPDGGPPSKRSADNRGTARNAPCMSLLLLVIRTARAQYALRLSGPRSVCWRGGLRERCRGNSNDEKHRGTTHARHRMSVSRANHRPKIRATAVDRKKKEAERLWRRLWSARRRAHQAAPGDVPIPVWLDGR